MELRFVKMHGSGNDFVLVEDLAEEWDLDADAVAWLCDRHFGVGADGLLAVRPATAPEADYLMVYHNADGSQAEMCGNGVRCFARYLDDRGMVTGDEVRVQTLAGVKPITILRGEDGGFELAVVDMGEPVLDPKLIPTTLSGDYAFDCPIATPAGEVRVTAISMGNPHAVVWVDDVDEAPVEELGPLIENHEAFPEKTNVGFAQAMGEARIRLRVWERGVGETLACGTGACAAAIAASLSCKAGRTSTVEVPGGELEVHWSEDGHVYLKGPAAEVFSGRIELEDEE